VRTALAVILVVLAVTSVGADKAPPPPPKKAKVIRGHFTVWRQPDGKKYPNQVKETYILERDGKLDSRAYFGGMPIDINHNDSIEWKGAAVTAVLDAMDGVKADMVLATDDKPLPDNGEGLYIATVNDAKGDTTRYAKDKTTAAWKAVDASFQKLLVEFEKATGRPLKPGQLPQTPRRP
jgi:hypothetical protein